MLANPTIIYREALLQIICNAWLKQEYTWDFIMYTEKNNITNDKDFHVMLCCHSWIVPF